MQAPEITYKILSDYASLVAVVSDRITPMEIAQTSVFPAICFRQISEPQNNTKSGHSKTNYARVQVDIVAYTYTEATSIAKLVRNAMFEVQPPITINGSMVLGVELLDQIPFTETTESEEGTFRIMQDYSICFNVGFAVVTDSYLLLENANFLLLESGNKIIL
jgi:hypothetical protein